MKKPTADERHQMCTRKRRYRTEADALEAAFLATGIHRASAYRCPLCGSWHVTSGSIRGRKHQA